MYSLYVVLSLWGSLCDVGKLMIINLKIPQVYHPNIDLEGNVCLNILREDWKPVLTINSIVYGLQYLFLVSIGIIYCCGAFQSPRIAKPILVVQCSPIYLFFIHIFLKLLHTGQTVSVDSCKQCDPKTLWFESLSTGAESRGSVEQGGSGSSTEQPTVI